MKFICDSAHLQKAISVVEKSVSQRSTLAVLENIFFEISAEGLKLRANDLEIGIETTIAVDSVETSGSVLVKAKTISPIISKLPNQTLTISVDSEQRVNIKGDRVNFDILGTSSAEYPVFPQIEAGSQISMTVKELRALISSTLYAVSFDTNKQFLNGILVKSEEDQLIFVSTDGYRLSKKTKGITPLEQAVSAIVPHKAMSELNRILQSAPEDKELQITVSEKQFALTLDSFILVSRLIQGQFPDYNMVIPAESDNQFSIPKSVLLEAAERASIIASASNNVVRFGFSDDRLEIRAIAPSLGEFKEDIAISRQKGSGECKIAFNIRLVVDAIKTMDSDEVNFSFSTELSPCRIEPSSDETYTAIVMPIRTSDFQRPSEPTEAVAEPVEV